MKRIKRKATRIELTYDPINKRVCTPGGTVPADDYERLRVLHPALAYPPISSMRSTPVYDIQK